MWQRIQTVFLAVAIVALLASLILPIWTIDVNSEKNVLTAFYYLKGNSYQYNPYCLTAIAAIASATLSLTEITKYKNRLTQLKLGALNSLLLAGTILSAIYFATQLAKGFEGVAGQYGLGLWLPGVAVVCNLLANRYIRKDEKLVRDSNRLR